MQNMPPHIEKPPVAPGTVKVANAAQAEVEPAKRARIPAIAVPAGVSARGNWPAYINFIVLSWFHPNCAPWRSN